MAELPEKNTTGRPRPGQERCYVLFHDPWGTAWDRRGCDCAVGAVCGVCVGQQLFWTRRH